MLQGLFISDPLCEPDLPSQRRFNGSTLCSVAHVAYRHLSTNSFLKLPICLCLSVCHLFANMIEQYIENRFSHFFYLRNQQPLGIQQAPNKCLLNRPISHVPQTLVIYSEIHFPEVLQQMMVQICLINCSNSRGSEIVFPKMREKFYFS